MTEHNKVKNDHSSKFSNLSNIGKFTAMIILHFDLQPQFKYMNDFIFISYILRFRIKFRFVKKRFGFYFHQSERRNEFLTREKIVSSNHKPRFKRIVFSRAFSRSSRVALSGSFDKILYFRCTRVVRNSNFQVIKS